ncbi:MAG: ATP-dependent RecD-like DNA helicase [Vicinamibacteraceae bacterium]
MDPTADRELVSGVVERITYHDQESGFAVLRVRAPGVADLTTVVGRMPAIASGEAIQAGGVWVRDRTHGMQFQAAWVRTAAPTSSEGLEKYLASGLLKGIGPHFAKRLVAAFGAEVFEVIESAPDRLRDVEGIGPQRALRISDGWRSQRAVRDIMVFLHGLGVGTSRAQRIYKTYGIDAIPILRDNPYRLARDVHGIGFVVADKMASKLGIAATAMIRVRAGVGYALAKAMDDGHCGLPEAELVTQAATLLEVPPALIAQAIDLELGAGGVVRDRVADDTLLFLATLHAAERGIAEQLTAIAAGAPPWPAIDADKALAWAGAQQGIALADEQRSAVALALRSKLLVLTGGPGVGKTTVLRTILQILMAKRVRPLLCAPTGRAAKRLAEVTGIEARTIHRLLEVNPRDGRFRRDERTPLDGDLIVVDEASMVDVPLMHALVRAVPRSAALLVVGDADQLPSVGPGQVLADLLASQALAVARLTTVFRQAAASRIVAAAHRINAGLMPQSTPDGEAGDFYLVDAADAERAAERVLALVRDRIPRRFGLDATRDIQVLCPMNRGAAGAKSLNLALQAALNPHAGPRLERFGSAFAPGDKVMQIENDYDKEVYNGDIGRVVSVDVEAGSLVVDIDGRSIPYDAGELDRLVLAYATTIHKAQGSEYPAVVIPLTTEHYPMLQRRLIYTAITRGRRLVVVVGPKKALGIAVGQATARRRWSKLAEWLAGPVRGARQHDRGAV